MKLNFIGDRVEVDIASKGLLAADLPNEMKAGETLQFYGASEFEFKDG